MTKRERAEKVNGAIGELSAFHEANGHYAEGVSIRTATLPVGWESRLHGWPLQSSSPAKALFLDKHDLVASKLAAFREKDRQFAASLIGHGLVDLGVIRERIAMLPADVPALWASASLPGLTAFQARHDWCACTGVG